jgi:hypothetical protein
VTVQNTGEFSGSTVVQVYVRDPVAETSQPVRRLVGYARVALAAGADTQITIAVPRQALAYTHRDGERRVDSGRYDFFVGQHASDGDAITLNLP